MHLDRFSLVEYYTREKSAVLEAVLIVRSPRLTEPEKAALDLVPPELTELNIGTVGRMAVTVTTITIALFVVAVHTPAFGGAITVRDRFRNVTLANERIQELGSMPAARELLALRQQLFSELF